MKLFIYLSESNLISTDLLIKWSSIISIYAHGHTHIFDLTLTKIDHIKIIVFYDE